jgi:hypothetical protein
MIKINIQMPEKCGLCPCFHFENPIYCQAVKADKNKKIVNPYGAPRPEWCPLKEQETTFEKDGHHIRCTSCGNYWCDTDSEGDLFPHNYCPHCGRKVKVE